MCLTGRPTLAQLPSSPGDPDTLFTQMKLQRIERPDERGNGVGPSCLFLDLLGSFIALYSLFPFLAALSNPNPLSKSNNSYGS